MLAVVHLVNLTFNKFLHGITGHQENRQLPQILLLNQKLFQNTKGQLMSLFNGHFRGQLMVLFLGTIGKSVATLSGYSSLQEEDVN